jgi:hypothetical protein
LSQTDFVHPNSLSPDSISTSDPLTPPPIEYNQFAPHVNALPGYSGYPAFQPPSAQFPYGHNSLDQLNAHLYAPQNGAIYGPSYGSVQNGNGNGGQDGRVHAGQKRGSNYDGFFDEVKKRKIEPTYDAGQFVLSSYSFIP